MDFKTMTHMADISNVESYEVHISFTEPFEPEKILRLKSGIRDESIPIRNFYTEEIAQSVSNAYAFEINKFGFLLP